MRTRPDPVAGHDPPAAEGAKPEPGGRARSAGRHGSLLSLGATIGNRRLRQALRVGAADDRAEREAERTADRVTGTTRPASTGPGPSSPSTAPPVVHGVLRGAGEPLRADVRGWMETRLGADLGGVRVHTGPDAAASARAVGARAYAVGPRLVFGERQYAPSTPAGRRLIAHELAHAAQGDAGVLRRDTYETRGADLQPAAMQAAIDQGYWTARTLATFEVISDARMTADPEERDAVFAAVWGLPPPTRVTAETVRIIPIAPRALPPPPAAAPANPAAAPAQGAQGQAPGAPGAPAAPAAPPAPTTAPALAYRAIFRPPATRGAKPRLELQFVASGAGTVPVAAPAAPAAFQPQQPRYTSFGFPANDMEAYMAAHPDEHHALFHWMETTAPTPFDQVVTTETRTTGRAPRVTHRSVFYVRGSRFPSGNLGSVRITLVSQGTTDAVQTVPTDYRAHDAGDWRIEQQRARTPVADRLGAVNGLAAVPAAELASVKIAITTYFSRDQHPVRNAEVDVRVPIGNTGTVALYTFAFGANNDVTVTRIGTAGTGAGQVDTGRISVERVRGFPGATAQPAALRAWWTARYPRGGTLTPQPAAAPGAQAQPAGPTSADLITQMNGFIATGAATTAWFSGNWGIEVMTAAQTTTRLQTVHHVPANLSDQTLDYDATDLRMLELALQTLTDTELARLRGVRMGRRGPSFQRGTGNSYSAAADTQFGLTLTDPVAGGAPDITVVYFGSLYTNNDRLFRGSTAANALPTVVMNVLHELGHATAHQAGIEAAFNAWRARNRPPDPTWYAATGASELFPEAFALYHTDPRWLCSSAPLLYAWFHELATTGTPPAATARLTPPAQCP